MHTFNSIWMDGDIEWASNAVYWVHSSRVLSSSVFVSLVPDTGACIIWPKCKIIRTRPLKGKRKLLERDREVRRGGNWRAPSYFCIHLIYFFRLFRVSKSLWIIFRIASCVCLSVLFYIWLSAGLDYWLYTWIFWWILFTSFTSQISWDCGWGVGGGEG